MQKVNLQSKRLSLQMLHPHGSTLIHRNLNCREEVTQPTLSSSPRGRATRAGPASSSFLSLVSLSLLSVAPNLLAASTSALRRDNKSDPV